MNMDMKDLAINELKRQLEEAFEFNVKTAFENNPLEGTPFKGSFILKSISNSVAGFKGGFSETAKFGVSENEINTLIDEIASKIIAKYKITAITNDPNDNIKPS